MRLPVRLPQFGESAAEATVVAWLATPGSAVKADQELVEVQTEKSLLTVSAPAEGVLAEHCVEPGRQLAVGDVLAYIEVLNGAPPAAQPAKPHPPKVAAKEAPKPLPGRGLDQRQAAVRAASGEGSFISPRVRAKLDEHGLKTSDLAFIPGTGTDGRITANDIDAYVSQGEPMSAVRQAVAGAMARSWSRPLATVALPCRFDALLAHRRTIEGRPSATIYAMRALAIALKAGNPLGCRLLGNRLLTPATIDLAVAVEINDGVLTPVVRRVEDLGLAALTVAIDDVIAKGRAGRINDAGDAVATISNYGTFGLTWATPIPLPGQGLILGIGAVQSVPDWNPATKNWDRARQAELTLTFDHRIADGGAAGRLLQMIGDLMEHPERM